MNIHQLSRTHTCMKGEIEALEKVQKFALRVCIPWPSPAWDSDYKDILSRTSLPSLQTRCVQMSLCHLYKIIHDLTDFPETPVSNRVIPYSNRSVNTQSLAQPTSLQDICIPKLFFFHLQSITGTSCQKRYWNVIPCGHSKGNY